MTWRVSRWQLLAGFAGFCLLGLILATSPEALQPLCGGKLPTRVSNDHTIRGSRGPDVIVGGSGANTIYGRGGNDVICGGPGRDRIFGERGNDTLEGKHDGDVVRGGRGSDEVDGGAGRDQVRGDSGNDALQGGPGGHDDVEGGLGDDEVDGGRGAFDMLLGGIGRDRIDGGPGAHDIVSYRNAGGPVVVNLERGSVTGAEEERLVGIEDVTGGSSDDLLTTSEEQPNRLEGGPGDDRLLGSLEQDQAFGGPGSDQCFGPFEVTQSCGSATDDGTRVELYKSLSDSASLAIAGDAGVEDITVVLRRDRYLIEDRAGGLVQVGDPRYSRGCKAIGLSVSCGGQVDSILVSLGPGADRIDLGRSVPSQVQVTVEGGSGSDRIHGGSGGDTLYGGDDSDPDWLAGGGGNDALFGVNILHPRHPSGTATLLGGPGNDLLIGGQPCEGGLFSGGPGRNDSASFSRVRNSGTYVAAEIGGTVSDPDAGGCAAGRISTSTEKIEGSPGPDLLIGSAGADVLLGRGGDDRLDGRGGADRCIGGSGGDRLRRCEYAK